MNEFFKRLKIFYSFDFASIDSLTILLNPFKGLETNKQSADVCIFANCVCVCKYNNTYKYNNYESHKPTKLFKKIYIKILEYLFLKKRKNRFSGVIFVSRNFISL